eukprot:9570992-Alexandrium_andersonii.AAC.1
MSASLVGSEMCIRDSRARSTRRRAQCCHAARAEVHTSEGVGRRNAPVSYTHLTLPTICSV